MSGTNAAAAKARLVGENSVLRGLPGLDGVDVFYSGPTGEPPREYITAGNVSGPVALAAFRGGGRIPRQEDLSLHLQIKVLQLGQRTPEQTDARAAEIATVVIDWIAANPTLGDLPDLKLAKVDDFELSGGTEIEASMSVVTLTIGLKSYLT